MGYLPYQLVQDFFHQRYHRPCTLVSHSQNWPANIFDLVQINMRQTGLRDTSQWCQNMSDFKTISKPISSKISNRQKKTHTCVCVHHSYSVWFLMCCVLRKNPFNLQNRQTWQPMWPKSGLPLGGVSGGDWAQLQVGSLKLCLEKFR